MMEKSCACLLPSRKLSEKPQKASTLDAATIPLLLNAFDRERGDGFVEQVGWQGSSPSGRRRDWIQEAAYRHTIHKGQIRESPWPAQRRSQCGDYDQGDVEPAGARADRRRKQRNAGDRSGFPRACEQRRSRKHQGRRPRRQASLYGRGWRRILTRETEEARPRLATWSVI